MTTEFDLFGMFSEPDPGPALTLLRQEEPVCFDQATGLWVVSRHRDVRRVLLDPDTFLPDNAQDPVVPLSVAALRVLAGVGFSLPPALANNGGPSHRGLRRLVSGFFSPRRVASAVPMMEHLAAGLLEEVRESWEAGRDADLVTDFAHPLPCGVLKALLGIRDVDAAVLLRWSDDALELFWGRPPAERQVELAASAAEFHRWLSAHVAEGPHNPGSLAEALCSHRLPDETLPDETLPDETLPEGIPLDAATAVAVCFFVFIAGHATTGQLIATALWRALADPGVWSRLGGEPGFAGAWVEEVLRREPPVTSWRRVAARDVELGGVPLEGGARLLLMLMSAGADPEVFEEPQGLCPYRENVRRHLAFGVGQHHCPGASLARTEAAVALRAAARAFPEGPSMVDGARPPVRGLLSFRAPLHLPMPGRVPDQVNGRV